MRVYPLVFLTFLIILIGLVSKVPETEALYPYVIKGFVTDVRHKPLLLIGGWALKKAILLKLLKIKWKLKKKFLFKKVVKKVLLKLFLGRKKRSLDNEEYYLPPEPKDNEISGYFSMTSELDGNACLPKGICEVMARGNRTQLNQFETIVHEYFDGHDGNHQLTPGTPEYIYDYAAYIGKSTRSERECARIFSQCSETTNSLNKFMDMTFVSDMCEGPNLNNGYISFNDPENESELPGFSHHSGQQTQESFNQPQHFLPLQTHANQRPVYPTEQRRPGKSTIRFE